MSEAEYKVIFAENLKRYMKEQHVTQMDIAKHLKVSQSTVSSWCNAEKMARMDKVQALANFFGIEKSNLLERKPDPTDYYTDTDAFRDRMKDEYGVLFDMVDKADDHQRDQIEAIIKAIVPVDEWE